MTSKLRNRVIFAGVLAAVAVTTAAAVPAQAQSHGKLDTQFTETYYATSADTGTPVGEWVYGYCPTYFSDMFGTKTAYFVLSSESC
jgi:hypothetical protein